MGGAPKPKPRVRYLFADATPFPVAGNFIETLVAMTDACVALYRADLEAETRRAKAAEARKHADEELHKVDSLEAWVDKGLRALLPDNPRKATDVEAAAAKLFRHAAATLKKTRASIHRRRDAAVRVALGYRLPHAVRDPVERFMLGHQLPSTRWSIEWTAGTKTEPASGQVRANAPQGVSAEFTTDLSDGRAWSGPLRVKDLIGSATVMLPKPNRPDKWIKVSLHKYVVTSVEATPKREAFTLKRTIKKPCEGLHVLMRGGKYATPIVTPIDAFGEAMADSHAVEGDPGKPLVALWQRLLSGAPKLVARRDSVVAVRLLDQSLSELESPAHLADAMLHCVAPLVREMRVRSNVPGRLTLKREVEGKLSEVSLSNDDLSAKITRLPTKFVRQFDSIGLGLDATMQYQAPSSRELPLQAAASSGALPLQPAASSGGLPRQAAASARELPLPAGPPTENDILDDDPDTERTERVADTEGDTLPRARPPEREDTPRDPTEPLDPVSGTINAA